MKTVLIANDAELGPWLARWRQAPFLALDTEFVREQTYHARLCLIQIGDGCDSVCIDPLAGLDLAPLWDLLLAPEAAPRVLHAAGQDLEILVQLTGRAPPAVFDTQIAAALLGLGDQLGYAGLVQRRLGVALDKRLARTPWDRRPLRDDELAYAADDVRHLAAIYPALRDELAERGRLEWLQQDCAALADPTRYRPDPDQEWRRLKGLVRLPARAQHVAAALAAWRDRVALQRNRPRRWILADEVLYALAERQPRNAEQLAALQALPPRTLEQHGPALLERIADAMVRETPPLVVEQRLDEAGKRRLKALQDTLRSRCEALGIPPGLVATRSDLETLLAQGPAADIAPLRGWRRDAVGQALLAAL